MYVNYGCIGSRPSTESYHMMLNQALLFPNRPFFKVAIKFGVPITDRHRCRKACLGTLPFQGLSFDASR